MCYVSMDEINTEKLQIYQLF